MIKIVIPPDNIPERTYAVKMIFAHFLGLNYVLNQEETEYTQVVWEDKKLLFTNKFWENSAPLSYLNERNFPKVQYVRCEWTTEENIPMLYGKGDFVRTENSIFCPIDVPASVFFMMTRWEEYVGGEKDTISRAEGKKSVAYTNGFLNRPIVNEYVEMVWNMMCSLGYQGDRKDRKFEIIPTHDIDHPYMRQRILKSGYYLMKSVIRRDWPSVISFCRDIFLDPYDVYDFFMDCSESIGAKSHFYFMSADPSTTQDKESPYYHSRKFSRIVESVRVRGHIIGFHPGVFSQISRVAWGEEKKRIETIVGQPISEGRQHYLCFSVPNTFRIWEENNMKIDSTLSYHDVEGFRCGTGDIFPVYNILTRKDSDLLERPLVVMDATLTGYQHYKMDKIKEVLDYYLSIGKKYRMPITLLFHNSSFTGGKGVELKKLYKEIFRN